MKRLIAGFVLMMNVPFIGAAFAAEVTPSITSGSLSFTGGVGMYNGSLKISGPNDFFEQRTSENGLPIFTLQGIGRLSDGVYNFTLSAATSERKKIDNSVNNGRGESAEDTAAVPYQTTGHFRVANGLIVVNENSGDAEDDVDADE